MRVTRLTYLVMTSALVGCGGGGGDGGGGTTNPPPPPPSNQSLGSITTSVTSLNLGAGDTQTISVSAFDTNGGLIANAGTPAFSSASASIAEVDGSGTVLAVRQGTTTINVSLSLGSVTRTASVATTVTGTLPSQSNVATTSGDFFSPNKVAVAQGGQVTWTFGGTEHTVVFSGVGSPGGITSGGYSSSHSRTFAQTGNFSYVCTIHAGMSGQVIVR